LKSTKYQVFLSSTYSDLVEERESIIKAILEMYHIPIGMEMFSAEDEDQWEIIRRTIEVSDYYILVLGLRYGSKTSEGISFTQKEYEYALERKIPILAFVMSDNVPLPKNKRDDDLSEISKFRELVLTNSKMAQFWDSKDQLIRNVSISLMKQIMQKPGIGWIRGDKAGAEEALSKELTSLSAENRELREKIGELESKVSLKIPALEVDIEPIFIDSTPSAFKKIAMPNILSLTDVEAHLLEYVSGEDIKKYNDAIPNQIDLDKYNYECEKIYKIENFSFPLVIEVSNRGSSKANNVFIDIKFPESVFVYEKNEEYKKPESIIPNNPIIRAHAEYSKKIQESISALSRLHSPFGIGNHFARATNIYNRNLRIPKLGPVNRGWWTSLDGRKITVKIDSLLHTRRMTFDDEYMIVPLVAGKHTIEVKIICEEYEAIEIKNIEFETS
jgi:hypothetical protein